MLGLSFRCNPECTSSAWSAYLLSLEVREGSYTMAKEFEVSAFEVVSRGAWNEVELEVEVIMDVTEWGDMGEERMKMGDIWPSKFDPIVRVLMFPLIFAGKGEGVDWWILSFIDICSVGLEEVKKERNFGFVWEIEMKYHWVV